MGDFNIITNDTKPSQLITNTISSNIKNENVFKKRV